MADIFTRYWRESRGIQKDKTEWEAVMENDIGRSMRKYKKILRLMIFSHVITLNNFLQVWLLSGKELVNAYAVWEASSVLLVCVYFIELYLQVFDGKESIGKYLFPKDGIAFFGNPLMKLLSSLTALHAVIKYTAFAPKAVSCIIIIAFTAVSIFLEIAFAKRIKGICGSKASELQPSVVFKSVKCTQSEMDSFSAAVGVAVLMAIVNWDHIFGIVKLDFPIVPIIGGINLAVLVICFIKLRSALCENEDFKASRNYKYLLRAFIFQLEANAIQIFINLTTFEPSFDTSIKTLLVIVCNTIFLSYTIVRLVRPLAVILNGMEQYLDSIKKQNG
jgi:hypothetical protein